MLASQAWRRFLPPLLLTGVLLAVYLTTLAPSLTWANSGADGGDLITAVLTGGVPHPTGYPLYLLLASLLQMLPVGSPALRMNLFSALATVLAAVLIYRLVVRTSGLRAWPAGLMAGLAFGLAPIVWSQAVITEVYALQSLLTVFLVLLYTRAESDSPAAQRNPTDWRGAALGLAMGNHLTTFLLAPAALLLSSLTRRQADGTSPGKRNGLATFHLNAPRLLQQVALFGLGLSIYLLIPLRAAADAPVNWGRAITLERLLWLVSARMYQDYYLGFQPPEIVDRIRSWAELLVQQWGFVVFALAVAAAVYFFRPSRLFLITLWLAVAHSVFAILYRAPDSYVYLTPVILSLAVWMGTGLAAFLTSDQPRWQRLGWVLTLVLLIAIAHSAVRAGPLLDASRDRRAVEFGRQLFETAPANAIVFVKGDEAAFTAWYFHFALQQRPDLSIVASELLHFDWYQETLKSSYPSLKNSQPFPWPETLIADNPARPVCFVEYLRDIQQAQIDCRPAP
jgi:hypothetical protein